ncbi:MAG: UDP-N-acetylmuramoyl-L-alanyl-D-glutamate--2,6-diaminopimelate ligase [Paludibacteraceae bacterium]|nr:UDP-N-acetylmuramoyl-L-alanyl-D-glutamate--2,6-diaminopimelate ligase [Paludibacteraceae bacterium]
MILKELLQNIDVLSIKGGTDIDITDIQFDSRLVHNGSLFVATVGTAVDGHTFISQCINAGAVAVVCETLPADCDKNVTYIQVSNSHLTLGLLASRFYGNPSKHLTLVGVTGTNGKTTIATLLWELTRALGHKSGLLSTVCNYVNEIPVPSTHTTPDALALNSLLRRMVDEGCEYCFMEVSSHSVVQERIAGLDFNGALFTNLTRDHIDFHKTFENYRDAKKHFFDSLGAKACTQSGAELPTFAVTNKDDRNGLVMTQNTLAHVYTYSTRSLTDYRAQILEEGFEGMLLSLNGQEVFVPLVGRFNVSNLLAIYGAALALGFDKDEVLRILSTLRPVNGRFETIRSHKGWTAVIDYAHTPDAVENVINTINAILRSGAHKEPAPRLITVVGCGGNRDKGKRPMMAQIAKRGSDQLILTSDNPRDEEPQDILNDMLAGLNDEERLTTLVIEDRRQAIRTACTLAQKNDVILIAGKGHEDYQIIKGVKHHFDDHEEVRAMI